MWITRAVYEHLVEEARASRAVTAQLEAELEASRAERAALRQALQNLQESTEADRSALRDAAQSLYAHLQMDAAGTKHFAEEIAKAANGRVIIEQRKVAALHERVAVADVNFGWCRQLVNMMQAERAALLNQRGIIVPTMRLSDSAPDAPTGLPAEGVGVPGAFEDADALANAIGLSFEDVGDEAAARLKLDHPADAFL